MAHVEDVINGTYNQGDWVNDPALSKPLDNGEIRATHRENQMRSEQGIPLRTDYVPNYNGSRVINRSTRSSLYFDINGKSYFNPLNNTYQQVPKQTQPYKY